MSESDQPNGTANGDVPEIELIIKVGMDYFWPKLIINHFQYHLCPWYIHRLCAENFSTIYFMCTECIRFANGALLFFFSFSSVCVRLFVRTQPNMRKMQTQYPCGYTFAVLLRGDTHRIGTLNGLRTYHTLAEICKMFILLDCCLRLSYREACNYFSASRGIRFLCVVD